MFCFPREKRHRTRNQHPGGAIQHPTMSTRSCWLSAPVLSCASEQYRPANAISSSHYNVTLLLKGTTRLYFHLLCLLLINTTSEGQGAAPWPRFLLTSCRAFRPCACRCVLYQEEGLRALHVTGALGTQRGCFVHCPGVPYFTSTWFLFPTRKDHLYNPHPQSIFMRISKPALQDVSAPAWLGLFSGYFPGCSSPVHHNSSLKHVQHKRRAAAGVLSVWDEIQLQEAAVCPAAIISTFVSFWLQHLFW